MNYFEFNERRTQRSAPVDVIDWPEITVTEGEPNADQLLELSLMKWTPAMDARPRHPGDRKGPA